MKKIMTMAVMLGLTGGAYAAEMCAGALVCIPGPMGQTMPSGSYSPAFDDLAVNASALQTQAAAPEVSPAATTSNMAADLSQLTVEILRDEALADPAAFIDAHTPEEVDAAFGFQRDRYQITDPNRIKNAIVRMTVDLTRQRLVIQSPTLNTEFKISSGVQGHRTAGSGKCFSPDVLEEMHYSSLYNNAPMPHSVFFNGNIAVHATSPANELLLGQVASHGCVRLSRVNAATVFALVRANGKANTAICVQGAPPK
ncbi:MAG: L,D-transpeptidase [Elusimicrobia bacterium]|nr:L,D-transpeptidase [Elusimicrobiota bacterium]